MSASEALAAPGGGRSRRSVLTLAALGVVYGDIGTSPLYALKEVFASPHHPVALSEANVLGILSLVFWSLMIVVTIKYITFIMRADNKGEGGIMALMALVLRQEKNPARARLLMLLGLFGAALFYGDGTITPAISVLSAIEGLEVAAPLLKPYVIPLTLVVLGALFLLQKRGTGSIGSLFGPLMVVWFVAIAALGIAEIVRTPLVLWALDPLYGISFLHANPRLGFLSLGAVVLVVTGAEALYADMGHFGKVPVRIAWTALVLPALTLNYFGQGALLLTTPQALANPFYHLAPAWGLYPLIAISTVATVIASQAVISGAFSMTQQAIQLGYAPRMEVQHTSSQQIGQIYLPAINWLLFVGVVALVVGFESSTRLAAAYGIAVTGTMAITTVLAFMVARAQWHWSAFKSVAIFGSFLAVDLAFFSANSTKIVEGGWFPLAFAVVVFTLMSTWKRGRALLTGRLDADAMPLDSFIASTALGCNTVPGTAIFMTTDVNAVPHALLHSLKHYKSLHARVVLLTAVVLDVPSVPASQRAAVEAMSARFYKVKLFFGFMDTPDIPEALEWCAEQGLAFDMMDTSFFLGRETVVPQPGSEMALWREHLFVAMFRNAGSMAAYFRLPANRVVELGGQVML